MNTQEVIQKVKEQGNEFGLLQFSFSAPIGSFGLPRLQIFISPFQDWDKVKETKYHVGEGCYSLKDFVDRLPFRTKDDRYSEIIGFKNLEKYLIQKYSKEKA